MWEKVKQNKKWIILAVFAALIVGGYLGLW